MHNMGKKPEASITAENNSEINKQNLENKKEDILFELGSIQKTLESLESNEEGYEYEYADTGDSMMTLDSILGSNEAYKESLVMRREASEKIMQGNAEEKKEGIKEAMAWVEKVKGLL